MIESLTNVLRQMPIFAGLSDSALQLILDSSSTIRLAAGDYLFHEGDGAESVFVLQTGRVVVEKKQHKKAVAVGRLAEGDCIGEMALIDFQSRSASIRAETDCQVIEIPARSLRSLLNDDLEQYVLIMMNMGREVSRRLRLADERLMMKQQQRS